MKKFIVVAFLLVACSQGPPGPQGQAGIQGPPGVSPSPAPTTSIICNGSDSDDAYTVSYSVSESCANVNVVGNHCGWNGKFYSPGSFGFDNCKVKFDGQAVICWEGD